MKTCPYCFEEIKSEAKKCRWCRSNLEPSLLPGSWYRDLPERRFLGVAASLAQHTRLPILAWRVIFILGSLIHGIGILVYFALWALTPFKANGRAPLERLTTAGKQAYQTIRKDDCANETVP